MNLLIRFFYIDKLWDISFGHERETAIKNYQ